MLPDRNYESYKSKSFIERFTGHIKTVHKHKKNVRKACFRMGLYYQGIVHDLSKFSPTEFIPSVKYYSGQFSPNAVDKKLTGASTSWLHHKGRNKHHFEYWTDYSMGPKPKMQGVRMPMRYVAEMVADRYAACIAYNKDMYDRKDAWTYYNRNGQYLDFDPDTRAVLEAALKTMRDESEEAAFKLMKRLLAITKGRDYDASILIKAGYDDSKHPDVEISISDKVF